MTRHNKKTSYFNFVDIPVIAFIGMSAGFFTVGFIQSTIGSLLDSVDGETFSTKAILSGILCVVISAAILGLTYLYWKLVPKRYGVVYPEFTGFGTLIAMMTMLSGIMLASELCSSILYAL